MESHTSKEMFFCMKEWVERNKETVAATTAVTILDLKYNYVWYTAMGVLVEACSKLKLIL